MALSRRAILCSIWKQTEALDWEKGEGWQNPNWPGQHSLARKPGIASPSTEREDTWQFHGKLGDTD